MGHAADPDFESLGTFLVAESVRDEFREGGWETWRKAYPDLFDDLDASNAKSQAKNADKPGGGHFAEWIGAILLLRVGGYRSVQSKYDLKKHKRKCEVLAGLAGAKLHDWIARQRRAQRAERRRVKALRPIKNGEVFEPGCPDLLVYNDDGSDWFFVDTKGPGDHVQVYQRPWFKEISKFTGRPVRLLCIDWLGGHESPAGHEGATGLRPTPGPPWTVTVRSFAETLPAPR